MNRTPCALLVVLALPSVVISGIPEVAVDCSRGGDLQRAIDWIESRGVGRVLVTGTCTGSYYVLRDSYVEIVGDGPATSGIQATVGQALDALGPGRVEIRNLRLTGGPSAVRATGPRRVVSIVGCEIDGTSRGVSVDAGAVLLLEDSTASGGNMGVGVFDSQVAIDGGTLHGSDFGLYLDHSKAWLDGVSVSGNSIGVLARYGSRVEVIGGSFTDNDPVHLNVEEGSRLVAYNAPIGASGDNGVYSVNVEETASAEIIVDDSTSEIWGHLLLDDGSFCSVQGTAVHGSVLVRGLSRLRLDAWVQDGSLSCDEASDAWCGPGASAFTSGCPSTPATCSPWQEDGEAAAGTPLPARERLTPRPKWTPHD
jgi:hypothetical protein